MYTYSFGVLLLEIVCCQQNLEVEENLTEWAYECYTDGSVESLVEDDMEAISDMKMVESFVMVAFQCLNEDPSLRPTMKKVMLMLQGIVQVSGPPHNPATSILSFEETKTIKYNYHYHIDTKKLKP
ncbi:G-type lectin S-receptor-like serine/threonine-protein kinase LECRK2 [Humulus lupulus]|uniref:G-type lectin S-receptor-like serine/threonine-protein kinase LECRK2 n=1 Tax=Humulus lupulus TaxID=3486 RepID=UPI002B403A45|nr:G-type lectin S-receptor-like serine/threonine-protein kinase LECRK2 [Humulus lupulus]